MLKSVLIANRGVIAMRVINACRELGIKSVLATSTTDRASLPAKIADETVCIGGPRSSESYLRIPAIMAAAMGLRVDGIHPGYGFLSENADLSQACEDSGIKFIGPPPGVLLRAGNKTEARQVAMNNAVPVLPGCVVPAGSIEPEFAAELESVTRYPLLIKAVHGGGGRGIRLVAEPSELPHAIEAAAKEAEAAFGNGELYVERFVRNGRHVEVQVVAARGGEQFHLWDRDCSIQRRHQKLIEEGPATAIDPKVRAEMHAAALRLVRGLEYENVGTVEFIVDMEHDEFFFLEINARIQVEHGVTECITGVDLVRTQLLIAGEESLGELQHPKQTTGHAIECRINAEDPANQFRPSPGTITRWKRPVVGGVRFDSHCFNGYVVSPYYDSLLAKVIAYGSDRGEAIEQLSRALSGLEIEGIHTTRDWSAQLIRTKEFAQAQIHTQWIDEKLNESTVPLT